MTIGDAFGILFGGQNAATNYLREKTYTDLQAAFAPKVRVSLGKPLVGDVSTTKSWNALTSAYNQVAATPVGVVANLKPRKLRGLMSHGMVLAVKQENTLQLLTPSAPVVNGSKVS